MKYLFITILIYP